MKVSVFGASGRTGRLVVDRALEAGHEVTVLVRDPARAPEAAGAGERLQVVTGDVRDASAVARTIAGADAIVSALGNSTPGPSSLLTDAMTTITNLAVKYAPGAPILTVGTVGTGSSPTQLRAPIRLLIKVVLHFPVKDHAGAEAALARGENPSLVVRCVGLVDGPATGSVTASAAQPVTGSRISRDDVAQYLVDHLDLATVTGAIPNEHAPGGGPGRGLVISLW